MKRCCEEDYGGSHYHCANCGEVSGMYGHYVKDGFTCQKEPREVRRAGSRAPDGAEGPTRG